MKTAIITLILIALSLFWPAWLEKRVRGPVLFVAWLMPIVTLGLGWMLR